MELKFWASKVKCIQKFEFVSPDCDSFLDKASKLFDQKLAEIL